jgi:hypothetical protein
MAINDRFAKKPAIRAAIIEALYIRGHFDEWVEGFGVVMALDVDAYNAYIGKED